MVSKLQKRDSTETREGGLWTQICIKKNEIPALSIANGIDFGDYNRIGLTKPNTFELSIIGIVTAYFKIIKLTSISILKIHRLMWKLAPGSLLGGKAPLSS